MSADARSAGDPAGTGIGRWLEPWIAALVPWVIRRSLRRDLGGVWVRGAERATAAVASGAVLVPNHHSWWDGYLVWLAQKRLGVRGAVLVREETLATYPYFRRLGAIPSRDPRGALRGLRAGAWVAVFAEGEQRAPGSLGPLRRGAAFFARSADVPLLPLALRVRMRGGQHPEAFLSFADAVPRGVDDAATTERLAGVLGAELGDLDREIDAAPLRGDPPGFERWLGGARSTDDRTAWLARLWRR